MAELEVTPADYPPWLHLEQGDRHCRLFADRESRSPPN